MYVLINIKNALIQDNSMNEPVLLTHLSAATMATNGLGCDLIEDAGLAIKRGRISWIGPMQDCPKDLAELPTHDFQANLALWDIKAAAELSYGIRINPLHTHVFGGVFDGA